MIELLAGLSGILGVLLVAALVYAFTYRDERDEARLDLTIARGDITALNNRITVLRGDNIAQQSTIDLLRTGHDSLAIERDELKRKLGRIEGERRAAMLAPPAQREAGAIAYTPKRDAKGKFLPKPKGPPKVKLVGEPKSKPSPIACG